MGSSSSQQPVQTTTTTSDPWSGAQPYLQQTMLNASNLYSGDVGYHPYTGPLQADYNLETFNPGYQAAAQQAKQDWFGTEGNQAARGLALSQMQNNGLTPELKSLYQQAQGNQNPYLQAMLDTSNRQISNKIGSSMSGAGRYGSGQHTDVAARAMAEAADPILAQDYARRQQQQQDILTGGLQRAGSWAQLSPTLDQAQYAGSDRLMGLGQWQMDRQQQAINNQVSQFNAQEARPWEQLARYQGIVAGPGALGGTKVSTATQPQIPTSQRIFGGAVAGAGLGSMFGAPGAAVGGLGGGLLGLL